MEKEQINQLLDKQRQYFYSGATLDLDFRISALKRLRASIRKHEASDSRRSEKRSWKKQFRELYVRDRTGALRDHTYAEKHPLLCKRTDRSHSSGTVPLPQFPQTIPLRRGPHHESVELSVSSHNRTSGRCHCSRKHSHPETKCLLTGYKRSDPPSDPRMLSMKNTLQLSQADVRKTHIFSVCTLITSSSREASLWEKRSCERLPNTSHQSLWSWVEKAPASWTKQPISALRQNVSYSASS